MITPEIKETFVKNLKRLMWKFEYNQKDLAKASKLQKVTIHRYYHGENFPRLSQLIKLTKCFGITIDDILFKDLREIYK